MNKSAMGIKTEWRAWLFERLFEWKTWLFGWIIAVLLYCLGSAVALDYLKVLLSWPVAASAITYFLVMNFKPQISELIPRLSSIGNVKFDPDSQGGKAIEETPIKPPPIAQIDPIEVMPPPGQIDIKGHPPKILNDSSQKETVEIWRRNSYIWEYKYLNLYLAKNTQRVLEWLDSRNQPIDLLEYDSIWSPYFPNQPEREAIFKALKDHYLIQITDGRFQITPKGKEYIQYRNNLPNPYLT